jgi:hypothetical protein
MGSPLWFDEVRPSGLQMDWMKQTIGGEITPPAMRGFLRRDRAGRGE